MVNQKKKKTPPARPAVAASNAMKEDAFSAPEAAVTTPSSEIRIEVSDSHPLKEGSSLVVRYRYTVPPRLHLFIYLCHPLLLLDSFN